MEVLIKAKGASLVSLQRLPEDEPRWPGGGDGGFD